MRSFSAQTWEPVGVSHQLGVLTKIYYALTNYCYRMRSFSAQTWEPVGLLTEKTEPLSGTHDPSGVRFLSYNSILGYL